MAAASDNQSASEPGSRKLRPIIPAADHALRDRWAIVVGISRYQNERWNLKFAHRDAEMFYELIRQTIFALAARAEHLPVRKTAERLRILIERNGDVYPEGYLNLGTAYAFLGEHERAIAALETAIVQQDPYPEAHYHLGRTLVEAGRDAARAVSELREAIGQEEPGNEDVTGRYYLGQALQAFVQQDILVETEGAYRDYLAGDAPLGREAEVQEFLEHRYDTV